MTGGTAPPPSPRAGAERLPPAVRSEGAAWPRTQAPGTRPLGDPRPSAYDDPVDPLDLIADAKIREASERGVFRDLPGRGKPLRLDPMEDVPAELRGAYSVLKTAGFLPEELELQRERLTLTALLDACADGEERVGLLRRQRDLELRYQLVLERRRRSQRTRGGPR